MASIMELFDIGQRDEYDIGRCYFMTDIPTPNEKNFLYIEDKIPHILKNFDMSMREKLSLKRESPESADIEHLLRFQLLDEHFIVNYSQHNGIRHTGHAILKVERTILLPEKRKNEIRFTPDYPIPHNDVMDICDNIALTYINEIIRFRI